MAVVSMQPRQAAYGCAVPDKRQTSKQRRAARNRAQREALAARREHAAAADQGRPATASAGSSGAAAGATSSAASLGGGAGRRGGGLASAAFGRPAGTRGPGDLAVLLALALAVAAAGISLVAALDDGSVPVDHEGEPLGAFAAVARESYAMVHGTEPATATTSYLDAAGPVVLLFMALPVLVAAGAFISHRRRIQSRPLTIGLIGMALVTIVNPFSIYFLPSLIALAVAGFQVRKLEMPARAGQGRAGRGDRAGGDQGVIDVDEVEDGSDGTRTETVSDKPGGSGDHGDDDGDVLADLEAEIEAEGPTDSGDEAHRDRGRGSEGRPSGQ